MNWIQKLFKSRKVDEPMNSTLNISDGSDSNLESLIEEYFEENLVGKFGDEDSEFVKEIIRDFVKNYYH